MSLGFKTASAIYEDIQESTRRGENSPFNIEMSACIYFDQGKIYVQFFGLDRGFQRLIDSRLWLSDFHYQNQTDRAEDVSEEDWNRREQIWDDIFAEETRYSSAGLSFRVMGSGDEIFVYNHCRKIEKERANEKRI